MNKQKWLDAAEILDAFRVVPRILLFAYGAYVLYVFDDLLSWYQALPAAERTLEASGLVGVLVTAVTGMGAWFSKLYIQTGRRWGPMMTGEGD